MTHDTKAADIWDWAARLSERTALDCRARELTKAIREAETTCGSCDFWMTPSCPREKHSNQTGRWSGPSASTIKCDKFAIKSWDARRVDGLRAELAAVEVKLDGGSA